MNQITREKLAAMIDHSLLPPSLTLDEVRDGCKLAARLKTASVCVRPSDVALAAEILSGCDVKVGTVIGFPHGTTSTVAKAAETRQAVADGADELDMVLNIGRLCSGEFDFVRSDIAAVVEAADGRCVKVILECCYLDAERIVAGCNVSLAAGANFVKTSTGFGSGGATLEDVRLMRQTVGDAVGVKAAGGIRTLETAITMIEAGATRLGATATEHILAELD